LLNRLAGKRISVVADSPGTTRDRVFAFVSWQGRELTVVDTGGWQAKPQGHLEKQVRQQVEAAIDQAGLIIFVVDVTDGVIPADEEIADVLRTANKPVVLAVNKVDTAKRANDVLDFGRLGVGEPIAVSAHHSLGIEGLMDVVLAALPPQPVHIEKRTDARLAIVGRPNVGKSSLLNALLGEERAIVNETPGTTRDSLDAELSCGDNQIVIIDTAGIRRRGKIGTGVDYYSVLRALQAISRCDVSLLLVDAAEFVTAQDMHIAGYIIEAGRGMMLVVNKWDLIPREQKREFRYGLEERLRFLSYVPIVYISAKLGSGVDTILPQVLRIWRERRKQLGQSEIDGWVQEAVSSHPPPRTGSRQLRISRVHQHESQPATFVFQVNDPRLAHFSYQRYLENQFRQRFGFRGVPLKLIFARTAHRISKGTDVPAQ